MERAAIRTPPQPTLSVFTLLMRTFSLVAAERRNAIVLRVLHDCCERKLIPGVKYTEMAPDRFKDFWR